MNEPTRVDFNGCRMSLNGLQMILDRLNQYGCITVVNVMPGSVESMALGAMLAKIAEIVRQGPKMDEIPLAPQP